MQSQQRKHRKTISIHALREEGDEYQPYIERKNLYFYPRPPRGGRPGTEGDPLDLAKFLSTPSARRATDMILPDVATGFISIHALREEGD